MSNNPFPGLRPFEQKETHLFFGRDGQSKELLKRLQDSRFLALVGVSGSGKSSLVRAGLLPALYGGLMSSVESDWRVAVFRPGNNPIRNMARALITEAGLGGESGLTDVEVAIAETTLRRGNLGLLELIKQARRKVRENGRPFLGANENVLLVVDQFEELFRIIEQYDELVRVKHLSDGNSDLAGTSVVDGLDSNPREEASAFVKLLLESTLRRDGKYDENVYIIVTMRSDYLGETAQFWGMPERINEGQYLIPRMNRDERRKAIVGPVAVAKGSIAEPLVNQLLNDAGENPGHLPILQHALMRMWELAGPASQRNGGLNLQHYEQIGRLSGALSQHANEAFDELSPEHQNLAAKVFKCLTEKGLANREIRRPMKIADICAVVGAQEEDVKTVVDCFRRQGRWFLMPPPHEKPMLGPDTLIDISHESLIAGWDKLSKWVNEEAESARTYKRLADTAILKERDAEDFYRGPALQLALRWRQENAPNPVWARRYHPEYGKAIAFLDDSVMDNQKREQAEKDRTSKELRRRRTYNIILGVMMIVTVGLAIFGFAAQQRALAAQQLVAREQEARAEREAQQRAIAEAGQNEAIRLRNDAYTAKQDAEDANGKLQASLKKEQDALKIANDAKALAITERDKARRLQVENQEQATTYGYFKTAFDEVAAGNHSGAVSSLQKALAYFEDKEKRALSESDSKENTANKISTHINIADVYRTSGPTSADEAVEAYEHAVDLIGTSNNQLLAPTLRKAASVWEKSEDIEEARQSAGYYDRAAFLYAGLGQSADASKSWVAAGRVMAQFTDDESFLKAAEHFERAISIHGGLTKQIASTSANIGDSYVNLLEERGKSADGEAVRPVADTGAARDNRASPEDRMREAGASYFRKAGDAYETLGDLEKAATMRRREASLLSQSTSSRLLNDAEEAFKKAATIYERDGKVAEQRALLLTAGETFIDSQSSIGRRMADQFFASVLALSSKTEVEKAKALEEIAESYGSSDDRSNKQKAVDYFSQASVIYQNLGNKDDQVSALIKAADALREVHEESLKEQITNLDLKAIDVYQGDPVRQAKAISHIASQYSSSDDVGQKKQAIYYYDLAAKVARDAGNKRLEVSYLLEKGTSIVDTGGEKFEANKVFDQAIAVDRSDIFQQTNTLSRIGAICAAREPTPWRDLAMEYYDRAIALAQQHHEKAAEVNALLAKSRGIAQLDKESGRPEMDDLYRRAIAVYNDDARKQVDTLLRIGRAALGTGRTEKQIERAEEYFKRALDLAANQPDKRIVASAHLEIGAGYQVASPRDKAIRHYKTALEISEANGDTYGQGMALYRLSIVNRAQAQELADRALPLFVKALPTLERSDQQKELADALYAMGSLYRLKKDYQSALDSYTRALSLYETLPDQAARVSSTQRIIDSTRSLRDRP